MHDHAHRQPQKLVDLAHPLRIALGQVVVHRDHMNPVPRQRIQIAGQRRHQRLAFAGLHFGDLALVQHHAANQLHVEVPHLHGAPTRLAHHREGLGQNLVQRLPFSRPQSVFVRDPFEPGRNPRSELHRLGLQLLVGKLRIPGSRSLMVATTGIKRLMIRSLEVPKILVSIVSKNTGFSVYQCKCRGLRTGSEARPPQMPLPRPIYPMR